jgi:uncharacterized membrane protein (UPF0182 family)
MRPPMPSFALSRRARIALITVGVIILLLILGSSFVGVYVNWLWFGSVGFRSVYTTVFWTRVVLFLVFGLVMAAGIGANLIIAFRVRPPFRPMSSEQQNLERYRVALEPRKKLILAVVMVIVGLAAGAAAEGDWKQWLLFLNGGSFGVTDPQFHRDISFYAWDYPVYRILLSFGFSLVIFSLLLSAAVHYLVGAIRLQTPGPKTTIAARRHVTLLVFAFIVLKAIAYWFDRYGLVFSNRGKVTGASYTDVHASLPAKTILFWIAVIIAIGVLASLWLKSPQLPVIGFVVLLILSIVINGIYPAIVQQVTVKPNASQKEAKYISRNIQATRAAYGIQTGTNVDYVPYTAVSSPDTAALASTDPTVGNIRILDPNIVSPTVTKFQQDGNVYGFASKLDVDRYTIDGTTHDYIVGVRELKASNLNGNQTNWINQHTNYTHGYGFVAAQADTDITTTGNNPGAFTEGGIPPTGALKLTNPDVYYGELMPNYSIVGDKTSKNEYDGNGTTKVSYTGSGGVSLGNIFNRLAFAVQYKQGNFVLNNVASAKGAKVIFNRDPRQALQKVAPFLQVDSDPYPIVDPSTGDIVWMLDGYTTLSNYPYSEQQSLSSLTSDTLTATNKTASQPNDSINYIRNSVKATVDAYTGKVTLYQWDTQDPVLKAWMKIFPKLVQPKASMPASIMAHVRYPEDLFEVQRATLAQYHVTDPVTFYNVGDKWTVPTDPTSTVNANQPPYYVLATPPGTSSNSAQFQLTSPMNVNNSTYLAADVSVDSDPGPDYGKITVLQLPRGSSAVQGPEQIFNVLSGNAVITKDLSLFNTTGGGSTVLHGNLLTLPIGKSFLYVEPLYTQGTGGGGTYPILSRVIVVYGDIIGYGATLSDALYNLSHPPVGITLNTSGSGSTTTTPTTTPTPTSSGSTSPTSTPSSGSATSVDGVLTQLDAAYLKLQTDTKAGNFALIGQDQQTIYTLLQQYATLRTAQSNSATPTATPSSSSSPAPTATKTS